MIDAVVQPEDLRDELDAPLRPLRRRKAREWPAKRNAIPPA